MAWSLAELPCALPGSAVSWLSFPAPLWTCLLARAAVGPVLFCSSLGHCVWVGDWRRMSGANAHGLGWRVPTSVISWALLQTNADPALCLVSPPPSWPRATLAHLTFPVGDYFSKAALVLSADSSALSLATLRFESGTKLWEGFESLSGAAVPHSCLRTLGQPGCCPCPAPGCTLPVETLLFWGCKAASVMETVARPKQIITLCIIINRVTVLEASLDFQLWQVIIIVPDMFWKGWV